jgi:hypothetical protein
VPLTPEGVEIFERQKEVFREEFGREPGPEDLVFFDPDASGLEPVPVDLSKLTAAMEITMIRSGVRHELIYAFPRHGGTARHEALVPHAAEGGARVWDLAMREYREQFGD